MSQAIKVRTQHERVASLAARECQVADRVRLQPHPCIVHLFLVHHFQEVGLFMQVMEYCPGGDLLKKIWRARRRAERDRRSYEPPTHANIWIGEVFLGLEHLHLQMHALIRDLKPENVVLNERGRSKLTDFGFGRFGAESSGAWTFGCPPGSPGYISPEILRQQRYDHKADLYSFGVLVWVLLSGGVGYDPQPRPPWGNRRNETDFRAHFQDWKFMRDCLERPEDNSAKRLSEDDKAFVAGLTQRRASSRPNHQELRQRYAVLTRLNLPEPGAGRDAIEAWVQERHEVGPTA